MLYFPDGRDHARKTIPSEGAKLILGAIMTEEKIEKAVTNEKLIEVIQNNEAIYNKYCEDYKDNTCKRMLGVK